ncbi:hypothetical protein [Mycolicibacterium houstonense]|uniref:hypothetical protein n=1 Tax=Mycolicibacterium houstonense TaxID=146021 RepID=UPI003F9A9E0C
MTDVNDEMNEITPEMVVPEDGHPSDEGVPSGTPADPEPVLTEDTSDPEPDVFPREVVEKLRRENGKYRQRAADADALAQRLHTELVRATGKLADPSDLPYDEDHLADADNMVAAIEDLLARKPHLAARKLAGDIGQGNRGPATGSFSLLSALKGV